jgi:hypothetical protein
MRPSSRARAAASESPVAAPAAFFDAFDEWLSSLSFDVQKVEEPTPAPA